MRKSQVRPHESVSAGDRAAIHGSSRFFDLDLENGLSPCRMTSMYTWLVGHLAGQSSVLDRVLSPKESRQGERTPAWLAGKRNMK